MPASLDQILESEEALKVAAGFEFTEGPLWHPDGFLYVSDVDARAQYHVSLPGGQRTVLRKESGVANGATFDLMGRIVACEQDARRVVRGDPGEQLEVIAESYRGARLNRCNDIVCRSDGTLFFTDPQRLLPESERFQGVSGLYALSPDGGLRRVAEDMNHPNGLAFSVDEATLYVSNSRPDPHLHAYDVALDGTLGNSRVFAEMPYEPAQAGTYFRAHSGELRPAAERGGVPDGMKVDSEGRVFCTGPGGTWVWNSEGNYLGLIRTPELPANLAWGDSDLRSLYITARASVYRLRTRAPGIRPPGQPG